MMTGEAGRILQRVLPERIVWAQPEYLPVNVAGIVEQVRARGDAALFEFAHRFGDPPFREVAPDELDAAFAATSPELRRAMEAVAARIERFALAQRASLGDFAYEIGGFRVGQQAIPVERVGIYVPGGCYPLPSSLLMGVVTARAAGVDQVLVCTPRALPEILTAARIAGADRVFQLGGAQAIAALAFGTESVPRVDCVAGPGNAYVAQAKRLVFGSCGVDTLAGPSEVAIIASAEAEAGWIAADLLAQAEHDTSSRVLLLTDDAALADAVDAALGEQIRWLETADTARASLMRHGYACVVPLHEAIAITNRLAPEHLELHGSRAEELAPAATAYGALFIGGQSAEVFGDYGIGPNHVLPTSSCARFAGGLSVFTFLTVRAFTRATGSLDANIVDDTMELARCEGLYGHLKAASCRGAASMDARPALLGS
ncbi:MAG TPA: histidinol dehydrogenase [Candidatus Cybelea sp.]|jgi:histidinol dehydrogenase